MAKKKKGSKRRSTKRKGPKRKPGMGILGKTGIALGFGAPMGISTMVGIDRAIAGKGFSITSRIMYGFYAFINALCLGFGFDMPFSNVILTLKNGTTKNQEMRARVPEGAYIPLVTIGASMAVIDVLLVKFLGKNVKMPGTNYNLI